MGITQAHERAYPPPLEAPCGWLRRRGQLKGARNGMFAERGTVRAGGLIFSWVIVIITLSGLGVLILPQVAEGELGTIPATVDIGIQLQLTRVSQLSFGQVRPGDTDGEVIVTPGTNQRSRTGGVGLSGSKFSRAVFIVTGTPNSFYTIAPVLAFSVHDSRGEPIEGLTLLEVTDLKSYSATVGAVTTSGQIGPGGVDSVFVGGTLLVPPTARNGKYEGDVTLTISHG